MKKIRTIAIVAAIALAACSCSRQDSRYYELVGGDGTTDFLEFLSDSTCRFCLPGPLETVCGYEMQDDYVIVHIAPLSVGVLKLEDDGSLTGQAPFFEGKWKKSRKK